MSTAKKKPAAVVGIVMGSDSDMPVMAKAAEILDKLGVDVIQGYYFDKPMPKGDMSARLKAPVYSLN